MTFFTDFKNAINDYPLTGVDLEIVSVAQNSGTGVVVNTNEIWKFKVKVTNHGYLDMQNVSLHVNARGGATIATTAAGPFTTSTHTVGPFASIQSGHSLTSSYIYFKAPGTEQPSTELVETHIAEWDGDINSLMVNQSTHASTPSATYAAQIYPL